MPEPAREDLLLWSGGDDGETCWLEDGPATRLCAGQLRQLGR